MVDIFKLADLEVKLGLLDENNKYSRIAELQRESSTAVEAQLKMAHRVKTAGLKKNAATARQGVGRIPSMGRSASTNGNGAEPSDESLFL